MTRYRNTSGLPLEVDDEGRIAFPGEGDVELADHPLVSDHVEQGRLVPVRMPEKPVSGDRSALTSSEK